MSDDLMGVSDKKRETIFIVDDNILILEIAKFILCCEYDVFALISGKDMFNLLDEVIPDLILLDIEMPDMDGYDITDRLKRNEDTEHIPVIFLTGRSDYESEARALTLGVVDYVTKPFSADVLKMRISLHLALQKQQRQLRISAEKADAANNAKSAYIANMSHEMRTPLNAILGLSELSLESAKANKELYQNLLKIQNAGATLLSIINDVLDVSKLESGNFVIISTEYDTAEMISDAVNQSILYTDEKPIEFVVNIAEDFPAKLIGDELRVKQILNNLSSNALKFTVSGKVELTISHTTSGDSTWVTVIVRDTGIGIRPEDVANIFKDYMQADIGANRKAFGTGLGLPISQKLAKVMGGDIKVESEYGKGSVFTARIRQGFVSDDVISPETIEAIKNFHAFEQGRRWGHVSLQLSLPYARILVVDDVDTNHAVAIGLLKRYSITADCVQSGPEAIEAVKNENVRYSAIFMDHMMPGMDGIEATRLIREIDSDYAKSVPIIAFTANAIYGNDEMFLNNGFQAFISKPIDLLHLDAIIREWVRDESKENRRYSEDLHPAPDPAQISSLLGIRVNGIDIRKGLERFGNIEGDYLNVLRAFRKNVPLILEKAEAVAEENLDSYTITVHGIKGSCYGICADKTAALAEALELAAKEVDYDFIAAHNTAFVENVRRLLTGIDEVFAQIESNSQKERKDEPDSQLLEKVLEACKRHDMAEIDEAVAELDAFVYESGGELVTWLREMSDEMNYAEISEKLSARGLQLCCNQKPSSAFSK